VQWLCITEEILHNCDGTYGPDSVGVVSAWCFPGAFDGVAPVHLDEVSERAASGRYRASPQAKNWIGVLVADVLHLDPSKDAKRIKTILEEWLRIGALKKTQLKDPATRQQKEFIVSRDFKAPEDEKADEKAAQKYQDDDDLDEHGISKSK
jgi:hypothetical protein